MFRKTISYLPEIDSKEQIEFVQKILNQKFTYLNESSRAYVYISEDDNYVVKTFKDSVGIEKQFSSWGMDLGKVPWSPKPGDALGSAEIMFDNTIDSYQLAYNKLREETRLIYIHTDKTNVLKSKFPRPQRDVFSN